MAKAGEGLFKRYLPKDIHEKVTKGEACLRIRSHTNALDAVATERHSRRCYQCALFVSETCFEPMRMSQKQTTGTYVVLCKH